MDKSPASLVDKLRATCLSFFGMLTDAEFKTWHSRLGLSTDCIELIRNIRASPPSRRVKSGSRNVRGRYPSDKMGRTIQFESHTVELSAIYRLEFDPAVLEFFDQPPPIQLHYLGSHGRPVGPITTPDFFVLRVSGTGWEEWKTEGRLQELSQAAPARYVRDESGWQCPPGEAVARPLGLTYALHSEAEINAVAIRNHRFLEDYVADTDQVSDAVSVSLRSVVKQNPGISIRDLLALARDRLKEEA